MENQNWTSSEETRTGDLTKGPVWRVIVRFAVPLLIGNILQQLYNITDSIIVGQFLGKEALAAVSASFSSITLSYHWLSASAVVFR